MMKKGCTILALLFTINAIAQPPQKKVLVFSRTLGYHHASIPEGIAAIQQLGAQHQLGVDTTTNSAWFTTDTLRHYAAVIFLSTSGEVLDSAQQRAFQKYIRAGGGYMGIHAASTTCYSWPWYGRLVGAYFNGHPKPQEAIVNVIDHQHATTRHLPVKWKWLDEWYNFKALPTDVHILLKVDETTYTGGKHGADHPIAWYHEFDGGRAFYTALGHFGTSYKEPLFLQHLWEGIVYVTGPGLPG
ncbi:ThuA domain-containing protein [Chitinophaga sp. MM2321]|uniref:ThuA domain-containing protein n=1 Tax=Chitinophaga sp. MM2321 TaxID=3137178 RepID=UPI0032D56E3C